uniref:Uncharacterized protein n=1 Tax=mine drainage metagenome TaxID=410659 RepID=E6Q011_9ZZZZ
MLRLILSVNPFFELKLMNGCLSVLD